MITMMRHLLLVALLSVNLGCRAIPTSTLDSSHKCEEQALDYMVANGLDYYQACDSTFHVDRSNTTTMDKTLVGPRSCTGHTFKQVKVIQTGTWWAPWKPATSCNYCGLSTGACSNTLGWSYTSSSSFSVGFDLGVEGGVKDSIQGSAGFNLGYTWSTSITESGSVTCNIPAGSVGQVWTQQLMGWSDSEVRTVIYSICGTVYSSWSGKQHADWPLTKDDGTTRAAGCSTGQANVKC